MKQLTQYIVNTVNRRSQSWNSYFSSNETRDYEAQFLFVLSRQANPADPAANRESGLLHHWVAVLPGKRGITEPLFLETTTGEIYSINPLTSNSCDEGNQAVEHDAQPKEDDASEVVDERTSQSGKAISRANSAQMKDEEQDSKTATLENEICSVDINLPTILIDGVKPLTDSFPYLSIEAVFDNTDFWATLTLNCTPTQVKVWLLIIQYCANKTF